MNDEYDVYVGHIKADKVTLVIVQCVKSANLFYN